MNCIEFRRILTTQPDTRAPDILRHGMQCSACAAFERRQNDFEQQLHSAIRVEVPEGLTSRILVRHNMKAKRSQHVRRNRWLSLAASVLLAIGIGAGTLYVNRPPSLQTAVLSHIYNEFYALDAHDDVKLTTVNSILKPFSAHATHALGEVDYARVCEMREGLGVHMILDDNHHPVTVLYMPNESVNGRQTLRDGHFRGIIVPTTTHGSMAIVGENRANVNEVEQRLRSAVQFAI